LRFGIITVNFLKIISKNTINMITNNKSSKDKARKRSQTPLRRPPRLKGEVAKLGIKPIRKKAKKK